MYTIKNPKVTVYSQLNNNFDWGLYSDAKRFLKREVQRFLRQIPFAKKLAKEIKENTSGYFLDWIDHIVIPGKEIGIAKHKHSGLEVKKMDLKDMTGLEISFTCPTCLKEIKDFRLNGYTLDFSGCSSCTGVTSCCIRCPECETEIELLVY